MSNTSTQRVIDRLRGIPGIETMPTRQRHLEIRLALMECEGADPDNMLAVVAIDSALTGILPRVKHSLGLTDDHLSGLIGKSRATVQAYITGRLREQLSAQACDKLLAILQLRLEEIQHLIADVRTAKTKSLS